MIHKVYIVTPCSRPENLQHLRLSLNFDFVEKWIIVHDRPNSETFTFGDSDQIIELACTADALFGNACRNMGIDHMMANDMRGFVFFLDDDNLVHPNMWKLLEEGLREDTFYTFDQQRSPNEKDILPGNKPIMNWIDTAMLLVHTELLSPVKDKSPVKDTSARIRWSLPEYCADGRLAETLMEKHKDKWVYVPGVYAYYNRLQYSKTA